MEENEKKQEEQKKWIEMNPIERLEYLERAMNKEILFSVNLLLLYIKNLKEMEKNKIVATTDLVEEGYKDRMLILIRDLKNVLEFMIEE